MIKLHIAAIFAKAKASTKEYFLLFISDNRLMIIRPEKAPIAKTI